MSKKYEYGYVKAQFEKDEYELLSKEYKNNKQKLEYICPKGHKGSISFGAWLHNQRCPKCNIGKIGANIKLTIEFIRQETKKDNYMLLSDKYENNSQKLKFKCPKDHICYISWNDWGSNHKCSICGNKRKSKCRKHSLKFVKKEFKREGLTVLSNEYKNAHQKLDVVCDAKNHHIKLSYGMFAHNHIRCSSCSHIRSKAELDIFDLVKSYFEDAVNGDRLLINPLELDIVIPSKKIAIEYCGLYWHSDLNGKDKNYHLNKLKECNKAGYNLITIFEDEWINKKDIVISRLKNILGVSDNSNIFARKCEIKEIDPSVKNIFLNNNHIQGQDTSSIKLGAFYQDKLVSVMTFSKGSIAKGSSSEKNIWELNRFCSDKNYSITGIASKLFKYFTRNFASKEIYSYSDKRWSYGNLYKVLGFDKSHDSDPNYWYLENNLRIHRFNFRKNVLNEKLDIFDSNLSEWNNMINNGYDRIWDCGNTKWIYKN